MFSISVVIPNYNGKNLLKENIPYIFNALKTSQISDYEIIISDDHSTDDSVTFIKDNHPSIILLENKQNKGFAGNINSGILAASKDLILLLNSDIQLTDEYFVTQLPFFEKSDTFGVFGKIIALDSDKIQDTSKYPDYKFGNIRASLNYIQKNQTTTYSFSLHGANTLVDRKKILELGGFNEIFNPYNWEDVDLGIKAWRLGYKIYYENSSFCRHPSSSTIKKEPKEKVKIISKRNKMYLNYLHFDGMELFYFFVLLYLKAFFRLCLVHRYYLKAFYLFHCSLPKLRESKREFKDLQITLSSYKSVRDITKYIRSTINYSEIVKFD